MTTDELRADVSRREAAGHEHLVLVVERARDPRGRRVRVLPGVVGDFLGRSNDGRGLVVDVKLADLRRYLQMLDSLAVPRDTK